MRKLLLGVVALGSLAAGFGSARAAVPVVVIAAPSVVTVQYEPDWREREEWRRRREIEFRREEWRRRQEWRRVHGYPPEPPPGFRGPPPPPPPPGYGYDYGPRY